MTVSNQHKIPLANSTSEFKDTRRTFKGLRIFLEGACEFDAAQFYQLMQSFCWGKNSNFSLSMPYDPSEPTTRMDSQLRAKYEKERST
jgi:hypothetical protein